MLRYDIDYYDILAVFRAGRRATPIRLAAKCASAHDTWGSVSFSATAVTLRCITFLSIMPLKSSAVPRRRYYYAYFISFRDYALLMHFDYWLIWGRLLSTTHFSYDIHYIRLDFSRCIIAILGFTYTETSLLHIFKKRKASRRRLVLLQLISRELLRFSLFSARSITARCRARFTFGLDARGHYQSDNARLRKRLFWRLILLAPLMSRYPVTFSGLRLSTNYFLRRARLPGFLSSMERWFSAATRAIDCRLISATSLITSREASSLFISGRAWLRAARRHLCLLFMKVMLDITLYYHFHHEREASATRSYAYALANATPKWRAVR